MRIGIFKLNTLMMLLAFTAVFALVTSSVFANRGPIVDEFIVNLDADPGEVITRTYTVTHDYAPDENGEYKPVTFTAEVYDFTQADNLFSGIPEYIEPSEVPAGLRMSEWITVEPAQFTLETYKDTQEITYTIRVPEGADAGTRTAAILLNPEVGVSVEPMAVETMDAEEATEEVDTTAEEVEETTEVVEDVVETQDGAQTGLSSRIANQIFLTVSGDQRLSLEVADFHVESIDGTIGESFWGAPVKAVVTFRNTGNVVLAPRGVISFHKGAEPENLAEPLFSAQLNEDLGRILPGAQRSFEFTWSPQSFIHYTATEIRGDDTITLYAGDANFEDYPVKEVKYGMNYDFNNINNILYGEYGVTLQYAADNGAEFNNEIDADTTITFSFMPVPVIIAIAVPVLLIVAIVGYVVFKKMQSKDSKPKAESKE